MYTRSFFIKFTFTKNKSKTGFVGFALYFWSFAWQWHVWNDQTDSQRQNKEIHLARATALVDYSGTMQRVSDNIIKMIRLTGQFG